jgi:hypothetical protein
MKQLNIFEVEQEYEVTNKYKFIKDKLSKYSIDKVYEKEIKNNGYLLREIYERLSKQKDYKEYMEELVSELLKILPLVEIDITKKENGIFKYDNGNYGYKMKSYVKDDLHYNGMTGPLYCLDMLPKELLGVD